MEVPAKVRGGVMGWADVGAVEGGQPDVGSCPDVKRWPDMGGHPGTVSRCGWRGVSSCCLRAQLVEGAQMWGAGLLGHPDVAVSLRLSRCELSPDDADRRRGATVGLECPAVGCHCRMLSRCGWHLRCCLDTRGHLRGVPGAGGHHPYIQLWVPPSPLSLVSSCSGHAPARHFPPRNKKKTTKKPPEIFALVWKILENTPRKKEHC